MDLLVQQGQGGHVVREEAGFVWLECGGAFVGQALFADVNSVCIQRGLFLWPEDEGRGGGVHWAKEGEGMGDPEEGAREGAREVERRREERWRVRFDLRAGQDSVLNRPDMRTAHSGQVHVPLPGCSLFYLW